jgi:hypothetical protein
MQAYNQHNNIRRHHRLVDILSLYNNIQVKILCRPSIASQYIISSWNMFTMVIELMIPRLPSWLYQLAGLSTHHTSGWTLLVDVTSG